MTEEQARNALAQRREALEKISERAAESRKPVVLDPQSVGRVSRIDAMQMQAMAQATEARRQQDLRRIEAALARLDAGEWGWCARCGEEIEPGRLSFDPAIPTCRACASGG